MDENLLVEKHSKKIPVLSTIFLILVIVLTAALFFVNMYLQKENEKISQDISTKELSIKSLKKDKNIQVYELLETYKGEISKLEANTEVVKYIDHLGDISKKYGVSFSGFSMSDGEIKTKVEVRKVPIGRENLAYQKTVKFIEEYRADENAIFDLGFINSFEGMDTIKFDITFKIKNKSNSQKEKTNLSDNKTENE